MHARTSRYCAGALHRMREPRSRATFRRYDRPRLTDTPSARMSLPAHDGGHSPRYWNPADSARRGALGALLRLLALGCGGGGGSRFAAGGMRGGVEPAIRARSVLHYSIAGLSARSGSSPCMALPVTARSRLASS